MTAPTDNETEAVAYLVVRVPERDLRTLIFAAEGERSITVTSEQEVAVLDPKELRALNLWDDASRVARQQAQTSPDPCNAWFGDRSEGGERCTRAHGHPDASEDGIGHSASARYQHTAENGPEGRVKRPEGITTVEWNVLDHGKPYLDEWTSEADACSYSNVATGPLIKRTRVTFPPVISDWEEA